MKKIICPECGATAFRQQTQYGWRNACCSLWSWGDAPLVDAETHKARQAAHNAFDPIWKKNHMSRSHAYQWLADCLGIPKKECHMKTMDSKRAWHVVELSKQKIKELKNETALSRVQKNRRCGDWSTNGWFKDSKAPVSIMQNAYNNSVLR